MYTTITVTVQEDAHWDRDEVKKTAVIDLSEITGAQYAAVAAAVAAVEALIHEAYSERITLLEQAEADRTANP